MEDVIKFLNKDKFVEYIGVTLNKVSTNMAVASLTVEEKHLNAGNVCQGGAIFTLADFTVAAVANASGVLSFTLQSDVKFLHSANLGDQLTATAIEVMLSKKIGHYRVEVHNELNDMIAVADAICYRKL